MNIADIDRGGLGRFVVLLLLGTPFGAMRLLTSGYTTLSVACFLCWFLVMCLLAGWLSRQKIVRRPFTILAMVFMGLLYAAVFTVEVNKKPGGDAPPPLGPGETGGASTGGAPLTPIATEAFSS